MNKTDFTNTAADGTIIRGTKFTYTYVSARNVWQASSGPPDVTITSQTAINGLDNYKEVLLSRDFPDVEEGSKFIIPANFWVWSDTPGTAALIIDVANVTVQNSGIIIGRGGNGGGNAGTAAIQITVGGVTIENNAGAYIAGGGGGGAGTYGGGGAGGGNGGGGSGGWFGSQNSGASIGSSTSGGGTSADGQVTKWGSAGAGGGGGVNVTGASDHTEPGGGGGRVLPGTGGSGVSYGGSTGGTGGSAGNAGTAGNGFGGGGGWGASGGGSGGGAGGAGVTTTDPYTMTNSGTIYGVY